MQGVIEETSDCMKLCNHQQDLIWYVKAELKVIDLGVWVWRGGGGGGGGGYAHLSH